MLCPTCGKESANRRVCGHCQTPYPKSMTTAPGERRSGEAPTIQETIAGLPPAVRYGVAAVVVLLVGFGAYSKMHDSDAPPGVVMPNIIKTPMSAAEAENLLKTVHQSAVVFPQGKAIEVQVNSPLPDKRLGLMAFVQQYARADEIVHGAKRMITFRDKGGDVFAKADPAVGVVLTR